MIFEERRLYPRIKLITKVAHLKGNDFRYFYSRDLSVGGIFLECEKPYPVGTKLELELPLPEVADRIHLKGEVIRVVEKTEGAKGNLVGMGIKFIDMDEETKAILADFIARELARS